MAMDAIFSACQIPFCQTALLLPSVMQPENAMECWWEPTYTSDIADWYSKIGGITFGAAQYVKTRHAYHLSNQL